MDSVKILLVAHKFLKDISTKSFIEEGQNNKKNIKIKHIRNNGLDRIRKKGHKKKKRLNHSIWSNIFLRVVKQIKSN